MKIKTFVITAAVTGLLMFIPALIMSMNTFTVQPAPGIQPNDVYAMMKQDPFAQAMKFDIVPVGHWKNGVKVFTGYAYVPSDETYKLGEKYAKEYDESFLEEGEFPLALTVSGGAKMLELQGVKIPQMGWDFSVGDYYETYINGKFFFEE